MSNQFSAVASAESMPSLRKPGQGFWRSFFAAWMAAYGNRVDANGNIMIGL
jgi:hypothetical protein